MTGLNDSVGCVRGVAQSGLERLVRDQEVAGSNPVTPILEVPPSAALTARERPVSPSPNRGTTLFPALLEKCYAAESVYRTASARRSTVEVVGVIRIQVNSCAVAMRSDRWSGCGSG